MMKRHVLMILLLLLASQGFCQQYRIVYDEASLPELYTAIQVYAEEQKNGEWQRIPQRHYQLTSPDADITNNSRLTYSRHVLYTQQGGLHINMLMGGDTLPLVLNLPLLQDIRYNLYTDSIKPVLNYYVNVEGVFSSGKVYPLDSSYVAIAASEGHMQGLEWVLPAQRNFEKITFTATSPYLPGKEKQVTLYLKKYKDPRDAEGYEEKRNR
jgi:hypothetical protein